MSAPIVKAVVWDLDHTLWHGTLAEGDPVAPRPEALALLDRFERAGVVQSVASKNDEADARAALERFGLLDRFVHPQISWSAKSATVAEIIRALGIGADAVVLVDDSAFERAEVAAALPQVRVLTVEELAADVDVQGQLAAPVTREGAARPAGYRDEARRREAQEAFVGTPAAFLESLGMVLAIRDATAEDLDRGAELTERTNQLNTSGQTYSVDELAAYGGRPGGRVLVADLTDRFGGYGTIGLCLARRELSWWTIDLLLMSCRVMNRNVGNALLAAVAQLAAADGVALRATYAPTGRNRQMQITYAMAGFAKVAPGPPLVYEHTAPAQLPVPAAIELVWSDRAPAGDRPPASTQVRA